MSKVIEAVFDKGAFKPLQAPDLPDGQHVRLVVQTRSPEEILRLAAEVYQGLSQEDIAEIERVALDRGHFFSR